MELGISFSFGERSSLMRGVNKVANPENEHSSSQVFALDVSLGLWDQLSTRMMLPLLNVSYSEGTESGSEFGLGDLSLWFRFGIDLFTDITPLKIGVAAGAFLPTGDTVQTGIPSNPNFASGTVDPLFALDASYELGAGFGTFVRVFLRLPLYDNSDGYQSGYSFLYMWGLNYRIETPIPLLNILVPSIALTGLNRSRDNLNGAEVTDSGGDWIYLTPGLAFLVTEEPLSGLNIYTSAQIPVYQFLQGTQLGEDYNLTVGISYNFELF